MVSQIEALLPAKGTNTRLVRNDSVPLYSRGLPSAFGSRPRKGNAGNRCDGYLVEPGLGGNDDTLDDSITWGLELRTSIAMGSCGSMDPAGEIELQATAQANINGMQAELKGQFRIEAEGQRLRENWTTQASLWERPFPFAW